MTWFGIVASVSTLGAAWVAMMLLTSMTRLHLKKLDNAAKGRNK